MFLAHMRLKVLNSGETLLAYFTCELLYLQMNGVHMARQMRLLYERLPASIMRTDMRLCFPMYARHVQPQMGGSFESLRASSLATPERPHIAVYTRHMTFHLSDSVERHLQYQNAHKK